MGVRAVNIGTRQNARLRGKNLIDCDYSEESILKAITKQIKSKGVIKSDHLYGSGNSAERLPKYLQKQQLVILRNSMLTKICPT